MVGPPISWQAAKRQVRVSAISSLSLPTILLCLRRPCHPWAKAIGWIGRGCGLTFAASFVDAGKSLVQLDLLQSIPPGAPSTCMPAPLCWQRLPLDLGRQVQSVWISRHWCQKATRSSSPSTGEEIPAKPQQDSHLFIRNQAWGESRRGGKQGTTLFLAPLPTTSNGSLEQEMPSPLLLCQGGGAAFILSGHRTSEGEDLLWYVCWGVGWGAPS